MTEAIQLELNFENKSEEEIKFLIMQKQIDEMNESMGKVRRKLFSQMGELNKRVDELLKENEDLKIILKEMRNEDKKTKWIYGQEGYLFNETEYQKSCF